MIEFVLCVFLGFVFLGMGCVVGWYFESQKSDREEEWFMAQIQRLVTENTALMREIAVLNEKLKEANDGKAD